MDYENWDYYKEHLQSYKTFRKHVKALSRKKKPKTVTIDVNEAISAIWALCASKLYYWILKLVEEKLIDGMSIEQNPTEFTAHHADAETYQCVISFNVLPKK